MHPSPPSSPSRASSPRAVLDPLTPLDVDMPSEDEDANWDLNTPERDRKDESDWYEKYAKVVDTDGNDISKHAPPALKVFWAHTYHTLSWEMRKVRRDYGKEEASERNKDRINLLAEMTEWYKQLVQQEAGVARLLRPHFWGEVHVPELRQKIFAHRRHAMLKDVAARDLPDHLARTRELRNELLWSHSHNHVDGYNFSDHDTPPESELDYRWVLRALRTRVQFDRVMPTVEFWESLDYKPYPPAIPPLPFLV